MRHRRRSWFGRRLVLGFAVALVVVPAAHAYPDEGAKVQDTFVQGVDDFPGSSQLAPQANGVAVQGEVKDGVGTSPGTVVIVGDDKRDIGARPTARILVGDDKQNVPLGTNYEPTVAAEYNQYAYRRALPQDLGPQAAIVVASDGFDWGDAGIGAGTVFAVMLLGAGALLAARHIGRPASV
jgi:hypothetical protein